MCVCVLITHICSYVSLKRRKNIVTLEVLNIQNGDYIALVERERKFLKHTKAETVGVHPVQRARRGGQAGRQDQREKVTSGGTLRRIRRIRDRMGYNERKRG